MTLSWPVRAGADRPAEPPPSDTPVYDALVAEFRERLIWTPEDEK